MLLAPPLRLAWALSLALPMVSALLLALALPLVSALLLAPALPELALPLALSLELSLQLMLAWDLLALVVTPAMERWRRPFLLGTLWLGLPRQ